MQGTDLFQKLQTIHIRHLVIRDDRIKCRCLEFLQAIQRRTGSSYGKFTPPFEEEFAEIEQIRLVINVQEGNHYL